MGLILARNDALNTNPPSGTSHLKGGVDDWLWTICAVYLLSFLVCVGLGARSLHGELIFHYIFALALLVGGISYFAMASDLGFVVIGEEFHRGETYQVFYVKYIFWVVAFPLISTALNLASGVSWATILYNIFLLWIWIISYLVSAFITTSYKWGFYAFGTVAYFIVAFNIFFGGFKSARTFGVARHYIILAGYVNLLWLLYVIAFAVTDGSNNISVESSFIYFGILDFLLVPVIAVAFLVFARSWDYEALNLNFTRYGRVRRNAGVFPEKPVAAEPHSASVVAPAEPTATAAHTGV